MKVSDIRKGIVDGMIENIDGKITKKKAEEITSEFMSEFGFTTKTPIEEGGVNWISKKLLKDNGYKVKNDVQSIIDEYIQKQANRRKRIQDKANK